MGLRMGVTSWPVNIVVPDIEECLLAEGGEAAEKKLMKSLREDYTIETNQADIDSRSWYGRCVVSR
jgi:hypothetical protein